MGAHQLVHIYNTPHVQRTAYCIQLYLCILSLVWIENNFYHKAQLFVLYLIIVYNISS